MASMAILPPNSDKRRATFAGAREESANNLNQVIQRGYEDVPILKPPVWGWEIATYFFVEGISAGIYTLGTIADVLGAKRCRETVTRGRLLALFTMMPAPGLLIHDLGRPERFHHMLRIVKLRSPMSVGSWALTGYAMFTTLGAMLAFREQMQRVPVLNKILVPDAVSSVAGLPFAVVMLSYPGVLLSSTSTPVWAQTHFLGALIACSSMSTAAAGMSLISEWTDDDVARTAMRRFERVVTAAEATALTAYLTTTGKAARPLLKGKQSKLFWLGGVIGGIVLPALLRTRRSRTANVASSILALAGGFALKWAIVHAGPESSRDRESAIHNGSPSTRDSYWGPSTKNS